MSTQTNEARIRAINDNDDEGGGGGEERENAFSNHFAAEWLALPTDTNVIRQAHKSIGGTAGAPHA